MKFEHPWFLWTLLFLIVPILVHLFNFRRYKKIFFTNTKLLFNLLEDTKKSSELKKKLILASRLLVLLFLILAFAQPFFNSKNKNNASQHAIVSVYIDNSFSMEHSSFGKSQLEWAKKSALEILNASKEKATYQIISNDFNEKQLQVLDYKTALTEVEKIQISSKNSDISKIFRKQEKTLENYSNSEKYFYWISDFQSYQATAIENPKKYAIQAIPLSNTEVENMYIDTAYLDAEILKLNQDALIIYTVKRQSLKDNKSSLIRCLVNNELKAEHEIKWNDALEKRDTFRFKILKDQWNSIQLSLSGDRMMFDNHYYLTFSVQPKPLVTVIGQNADSRYINYAFNTDNNFDIHSYSTFSLPKEEWVNSSLLVMNQFVAPSPQWTQTVLSYIKTGKNVVIFMNNNSSLAQYNAEFKELGMNTIQQKVTQNAMIHQINSNDIIFKNIFSKLDERADYPYSNLYYSLDGYSKRAKDVLITLNSGHPFLVKYSRIGEGNIYLFTSSIDELNSNFVKSSFFAPLMFKLGNVTNSTSILSNIIESNSTISLPLSASNSEKVFYLKSKDLQIIPPQRQIGNVLTLNIGDELTQDGLYSLAEKDKKDEFELALNYSRKESLMKFLTEKELLEKYEKNHLSITHQGQIEAKHREIVEGNHFWKYCIALALLFLLIEMLLVLFFDSWRSKIHNT